LWPDGEWAFDSANRQSTPVLIFHQLDNIYLCLVYE
jgi:hypothetical protein